MFLQILYLKSEKCLIDKNMDSNYLENLYSENILEHSRNPKNKVEAIETECEFCLGLGNNADCGDRAELFLDIEDEKIKNVSWAGNGCALSQAGMSLMTEKIKNDKLQIQDLKLWTPANIYELLGVQISPSRVNCALLSYRCLTDVLRKIK
ncbi:hypothetical protein SDC9_07797 [bioreactor metagenome]|uniref:NIF system FeS cluster assembly NifU N-terminal domain-containing protein n=1 Tax=bioreactor metagenome TaxID=1076179 RepID=A0A644T7L1_9ZZZZ